MSDILTDIRPDGVATVTMNRAAVHNAFNETVIADLDRAFRRLGDDPSVRIVLLRGAGKSFSAGADLGWMQRMAGYSREENVADALALARMMQAIDRCPRPTVAVVHGAAFGGGVGLVAACDIVVASEAASFSLSEVRLGLIPAAISPYVVAAMGERACRRYFLSAERFSAAEAMRLGLVHELAPADGLETAVERMVRSLLDCAPGAQTEAKDLIRAVSRRPTDDAVLADTADRIATRRASAEGREGVGAFLEKRDPSWRTPA
ncbi:enoyl-CoA hydratase/isomerase family protein [Azospirillum sp. RWY-5-1]|uniref:Enoyl-CoA hydratase/isomerase family protein n=1 Tax=Azospirillum oleiclasticum TaxID=2735135 RepID=A0ABX2TJF4_9PROT|nr:enoyl-CoA hydratase/isomerase family protein [Azospirillum oleiclasticum]NYZ16787.1 enoyl-CoA hydratase/isomerase family protein [Azospirillum oleiclasticum]NYZ24479.1 enoyl-CoA hydratase/isomerase family protein [Azospirillum oleiclasticum]